MADADTDGTDLRRLTQRVAVPGAREPFGAYLYSSDEAGAELGRHLERVVFLEAFGDSPEVLAREFAVYEASSVFICVIDHLRWLPAGVMRIVLPSPAGFKSLNDIEPVWGESAEVLIERTGLALDLDRTWDIATLALGTDYRAPAAAGLVTMGLYQTLSLAARSCGIEWLVAIFDMPVYRLIRWKLRMIFAGFDGVAPLPYIGSVASIPAWCDVVAAERRLAAEDPDLHAILVEGTGLEPALRRVDLASIGYLQAWQGRAAAGE